MHIEKEQVINPKTKAPCRAVAFSPDGNYLLDGNYLGFITVRATNNVGEILNRFLSQTTIIETIRFEPETNLAYVMGAGFEGENDFGAIKIFEIPSGKKYGELKGHKDDVTDICFLYGEERIALSVGLDGKAIAHNINNNNHWVCYDYGEYLNTCAARPNFETHAAIGGDSDFTYVLDVSSNTLVATLFTPGDTNGLLWSKDGRYLLIGGDDKTIQYFDSQSGWSKVSKIDLPASIKKACYDTLIEDRGLFPCYDSKVYSVPLEPSSEMFLKIVTPVKELVWGTNVAAFGNFVATPSFGDSPYVLDRNIGNDDNRTLLKPNPSYGCNWVCLSHNNNMLAITHDDGKLRLRSMKDGRLIKIISPKSNSLLMGASFHPEESIIATIDFEGKVFLINFETGETLQSESMPFGPGITLAFSKTGEFLAVGGYGPDGWVFTYKEGRLMNKVKLASPNEGVVKSIIFTNEDQIIVGSGDGNVVVHSLVDNNWNLDKVIDTDMNLCNGVSFSSASRNIYAVGRDQSVRSFSIDTGEETNQGFCHTRSIKSVDSSSCGNYIVSGSYDRTILIWNQDLLTLSPPLRLPNGGISSVKIYNQKIFSCSFDGYVCCWDIVRGNLLWTKNSLDSYNGQ